MGSFEIEVGKTRRIFCSEEILKSFEISSQKLIIDNERNRMITTVSYLGPSSPNRPPVDCEEHIKRGDSIGDLFCSFDS